MGVSGAGNFDDDAALDKLGDFVQGIVDEIEHSIENESLEPDEEAGAWLPCQVEILTLLATDLGATLPPAETIERWRDEYISVWEDYIDELDPDDDYRADRRSTLDRTFTQAIAASRS